jgi:hypothetical protein
MLSPNAQRLFDQLPEDGTAVGNSKLRENINLSSNEYESATEELLTNNVVQKWRGRGGSLRRVTFKTN